MSAPRRVVHFEIHAEDPERAIRFYSSLFGWQFQKWAGPMDYWLITSGPEGVAGINGGLMRRMGPPPVSGQPVNGYVCTVKTDSLDADAERITPGGGVIVVPKMPIRGVGWLVYAHDTEGNIFGLMQDDPSAG